MNTNASQLTPWWSYPDQLSALVRWLHDHDKLDTSDIGALCEVLATPWSWDREHGEMVAERAGAIYLPTYAVDDLDTDAHDASDVPLEDSTIPVTLSDVRDVCTHFNIGARVCATDGHLVGIMDRLGDFHSSDETTELESSLSMSLAMRRALAGGSQ